MYQSRRAWLEHEVETHYLGNDSNRSASCLLCGAELLRFASLKLHMGKHQPELALFALPLVSRVYDDDDDDGNESFGFVGGSLNDFDVSAKGGNQEESLIFDNEVAGERPEGAEAIIAGQPEQLR